MAIQKRELPLLISGKIGNIVYRVVNGKQVVGKPPSPRRSKPSTREFGIRRNFSIAIKFAKPLTPLLRKYDERYKKGFNKAISLFLRNALTGSDPNQRIDFSKVILGEGSLPNPKTYSVESPAKGLLEFNWSLDMARRRLSKSDRIFTVVYNEARHKFLYELCGTERRERQFLMDVSGFSGNRIHVWFGFQSADGSCVSTSIYAGAIDVL